MQLQCRYDGHIMQMAQHLLQLSVTAVCPLKIKVSGQHKAIAMQ